MKKLIIDNWILILLLLYYIIISLFDFKIIPDFLLIGKHVEPQAIYQTIIGSITTILGLIAIVFVIQFEILYKYIGKNASNFFSQNKQFIKLLKWNSVSLTTAFISLILLNNANKNIEATQLYFCILIFIISIYQIVNFSRIFLKIGNIDSQVIETIKLISHDDFKHHGNLNYEHILPYLKQIEESRFGLLKKIGSS